MMTDDKRYISITKVQNHVPPTRCFKFSTTIGHNFGTTQLYSLKVNQKIPPTKKKNHGDFQGVTLTSFSKKKIRNVKESATSN